MASKEKVTIKRSDQFQEVDEELSRAIADLDCTIERVSAIFDGDADEDSPVKPESFVEAAESTEAIQSDTKAKNKSSKAAHESDSPNSETGANTAEANGE